MPSPRRILRRNGRNQRLFLDRANEAVAEPRQRFDETRSCRVVAECFAQPGDGVIQTMIEIDKNTRRPDPLSQFVTCDDLPSTFQQQQQNLIGLLLKPKTGSMLAQLVCERIDLEYIEAVIRRLLGRSAQWGMLGPLAGVCQLPSPYTSAFKTCVSWYREASQMRYLTKMPSYFNALLREKLGTNR